MAPAPKTPIAQIHLQLLKQSVVDPDAAIATGKRPTAVDPAGDVLPGARLYYVAPPRAPVSWQRFLAPAFGAGLPTLYSQHASAVLIFRAANRLFAATFGYGRSLLADSALETDFGLRTALNLCEPSTLRTVDYRTIEERTRIGRVQLSEEGSVAAFRMDTDTDLLRGLEARSKDETVCERLAARWENLTVSARVELKDLPALAVKLLRAYRRRSLPPEFDWIDNVQRVSDAALAAELDEELEGRIDSGRHDRIRLAVPEIAGDGIGLNARLFRPDGVEFASDISVYLTSRPRAVASTIDAAKRSHDVVLVDASTGAERHAIAVYRCVVAEVELRGGLYLLADGEWFRLDRDFVAEVNAAIGAIPRFRHSFPAWNRSEHEGPWNERACAACPDAALLDRSNLSHGGSRSRIEPADLVTRRRILGHVKRRDKNSSGLSHLFAQGAVAAELINRDRSFRQKLAAELPRSHAALAAELRSANFDPRPWTIGYILLGADPARPGEGLPFFSKVNLRKHCSRLKSMQYRVGLIGT